MLAVIHNEEIAASMGVNVSRVYMAAFSVGVLLAALGGAFTAPKISMQPGSRSDVIILSFAIVIIGGLGSIEGAAVGAVLVGLAAPLAVHLMPVAELFLIYICHGGRADVPARRPVSARDGEADLMVQARYHPLVMLLAVIAATLFGRVLPTWTLSLATVAASNALVALGIVVLARTGNVSFGQGLFFAAGGYGVALIANNWGITDAVAQMLIGAVCGGLLGLVIGPLIARYSGIFFGMLTLALSMVFYGALVKTTVLGGSDGFNVGRPSLFGIGFVDPREADFMLYAVSVVTTGLAGIAATVLFRSEFGLVSLAVRENNLRVEYLGISTKRIIAINFVVAAVFAGASGAFALMAQRHIDPQFAYWTTSGEFVFVAVLAGYQSVVAVFVASLALELVRSFSNLYLPNTWQLVLGLFLLAVILFLPRGIGSLWTSERRKQAEPAASTPTAAEEGGSAVKAVLSVRGLEQAIWRGGRRRRPLDRHRGRREGQPDRRQRRRQDHLRQHGDRISQARQRLDRARRARHRTALAATRRAARHLALVPDPAIVHRPHRGRKPGRRHRRRARRSALPSLRRPRRADAARRRSNCCSASASRHQADRPISELAGGVRKLIDIAMALVAPTETAAAGRADIGRLGGGEVPDDGPRDPRRRARCRHHRLRRARHGDRQPLRRPGGRVLRGRIIADGDPQAVLSDPDVRRYVTGGCVERRKRRCSRSMTWSSRSSRCRRCAASPCSCRAAPWRASSAATAPARPP